MKKLEMPGEVLYCNLSKKNTVGASGLLFSLLLEVWIAGLQIASVFTTISLCNFFHLLHYISVKIV